MDILNFESDYVEGAHPALLEALLRTNMEAQSGYGLDAYSARAEEKIREACGQKKAAVRFLAGGTQTNAVTIDALLTRYEGVISASTGHINCHEGGAIESGGHKVLSLPEHLGKLDAAELEEYLRKFYADGSAEHMVQPGMVYITHPTEYGTLYSLAELKAISAVCRRYALPLYLDGARLGYGLMSRHTDVALPDIAELCDVFYIGGTKVGALCGEALVFPRGNIPPHFLTQMKQHGALLAKGRLIGVQFDALFTDGLYFRIAQNAIDRAEEMKALLLEKGYPLYIDSPTNQQFPVLTRAQDEALKKRLAYTFWEEADAEHIVVRMAASWATTPEKIKALAEVL